MARFAVLCVVLALSLRQIKMQPSERRTRDTNDNIINSDDDEINVFKFPNDVKDGMKIDIKGTMETNNLLRTFIQSVGGQDNLCSVHYSDGTIQADCGNYHCSPQIYSREFLSEEPTFSLTISVSKKKINLDKTLDIVDIKLDIDNNGPAEISCYINNLNDIGYITMKDVKVTHLLFTYGQRTFCET